MCLISYDALGTSRQLGTIIEGESLLNDGGAIVLFHTFYALSFEKASSKSSSAFKISSHNICIVAPFLLFYAPHTSPPPLRDGFGYSLSMPLCIINWSYNISHDKSISSHSFSDKTSLVLSSTCIWWIRIGPSRW